MVSAVRLLPAILARCHATCGWVSYRLGLRRQARRHYEHVLRLSGDHFSAYIHLGRLAYDTGDYAGWRREFEHARRTDPTRFAHLRHPFELFEPRLAGTSFDDAGSRATWRAVSPLGHSSLRCGNAGDTATGDNERNALDPLAGVDVPATLPAREEADRLLLDDCGSEAERDRLAALGPIRPIEWKLCDFDELLRQLGS